MNLITFKTNINGMKFLIFSLYRNIKSGPNELMKNFTLIRTISTQHFSYMKLIKMKLKGLLVSRFHGVLQSLTSELDGRIIVGPFWVKTS